MCGYPGPVWRSRRSLPLTQASMTPPMRPNRWPSHETNPPRRQQPEDQPSVEDGHGHGYQDGHEAPLEEPTRYQVAEVAEHQAARADVDSISACQPDARAREHRNEDRDCQQRPCATHAHESTSTSSGPLLDSRWMKPSCTNIWSGMPNRLEVSRGTTPNRWRSRPVNWSRAVKTQSKATNPSSQTNARIQAIRSAWAYGELLVTPAVRRNAVSAAPSCLRRRC